MIQKQTKMRQKTLTNPTALKTLTSNVLLHSSGVFGSVAAMILFALRVVSLTERFEPDQLRFCRSVLKYWEQGSETDMARTVTIRHKRMGTANARLCERGNAVKFYSPWS